MKSNNKKGFSLIELLAVVLIIGVLAAIAMPMFQRAILKSRSAEVNNLLTIVRTRQAQNFAKNREYDSTFETRNLQQITKDASVEVNNGAFKTVNNDYELELVNEVITAEDGSKKNFKCVIGRYKPNGEANFAFAISYVKSGLACSDSQTGASNVDTNSVYTKRICSSFGDIVVGSIEDLCEVSDAEIDYTPNENCCVPYEFWNFQTQRCETMQEPPQNMQLVSKEEGCVRCLYCSEGNCEDGQIQVVKDPSNPANSTPAIDDFVFECTDPNAAEGTTPISEGLYSCHSRYFKVWGGSNVCNWICPPNEDHSNICPEGKTWRSDLCICECAAGELCGCHPTQEWQPNPQYVQGDCRCLSDEAYYTNSQSPCTCKARPQFGEPAGYRVLKEPYKHCFCDATNYKPVFFGTVKAINANLCVQTENTLTCDPAYTLGEERIISQAISVDQAKAYVQESPVQEWLAACCPNSDFISAAGSVNGVEFDACCPHTQIMEDGAQTDIHINFNTETFHCCSSANPFFRQQPTQSSEISVQDPTYPTRSIGNVEGSFCHKCQELTNAHDETYGCYACPGKTFTTWGGNVSTCSCPTGTTGDNTITPTSENCQCKKHNADWNSTIAYVDYADGQGTGFVGDDTWHANNGACKCITGYTDTYLGKQIGLADTQDVDASNGYCCPTDNSVKIYNNNGFDTSMSDQRACCPEGKKYFHNTTFANNSCGICKNQTDTYVNGQCLPCPKGMEPRWSESKGYSLCYCPQGTRPETGQDGIEATENICKCNLDNATWTWPSGVSNEDFLNAVVNNSTSSLQGWHDTHGYCTCNSDFGYSTQGTEATSSGYCCPTTKPNTFSQLWHQTQDNPQDGFCCSDAVGFNDEVGYQACCPAGSPNYFNLSDLAAEGLTEPNRAGYESDGTVINSVAQNGGCSPCTHPNWTFKEDRCEPCKSPKVPVWNNDRDNGYSVCKCPFGTTEEQPSWWQNLLSWFGYSIQEQGCYCTIPGTVWKEEEVNGSHCVCYKDPDTQLTTAVDGKQACCQEDEVYATPGLSGSWGYEDHRCCPSDKQFFYNESCHICPQDRPHHWDNDPEAGDPKYSYKGGFSELSQYVSRFCNVCPKGMHEYAGQCCNDTLENCISCPHCTSTSSDTISCVQGENGTVSPVVSWNGTEFACSCGNTTTYSSTAGCLCPSKCGENGLTSLQYGQYFFQASCDCGEPREFKTGCCTNSDIACCQCKEGYVDFGQEGDHSQNGCCPNEDYTEGACCGKVGNQAIAYNPYDKNCCTADAPNYDAENKRCYKCAANQIWNGTNCVSCPQNQYPDPDSWQNGAYTQCKCMVGSTTGQGYAISFTGMTGNGAVCKCENANEHYLNAQTLETATYSISSNGAAEENEECKACPDDLPFSEGKCQCPANSTWSSTHNHCARCPDTQVWNPSANNGQGACVDCGGPTEVDTNSWQYYPDLKFGAYTQCKCSSGYYSTGGPTRKIPYNYDLIPGVDGCFCSGNQYWQYSGNHTVNNITYTGYPSGEYDNSQCGVCGTYKDSTIGCSCNANLHQVIDTDTHRCKCENQYDINYYPLNTFTYASCDINTDSNCACLTCPTERGFSYTSNQGCFCGAKIIDPDSLVYSSAQPGTYVNANGIDQGYYCGTCSGALYDDSVSQCSCKQWGFNYNGKAWHAKVTAEVYYDSNPNADQGNVIDNYGILATIDTSAGQKTVGVCYFQCPKDSNETIRLMKVRVNNTNNLWYSLWCDATCDNNQCGVGHRVCNTNANTCSFSQNSVEVTTEESLTGW